MRNRIIMILLFFFFTKKHEEKEKGKREFNDVYCLDKKGGRMYDSKPRHLFSPTNKSSLIQYYKHSWVTLPLGTCQLPHTKKKKLKKSKELCFRVTTVTISHGWNMHANAFITLFTFLGQKVNMFFDNISFILGTAH